jgi:hypothetical protein
MISENRGTLRPVTYFVQNQSLGEIWFDLVLAVQPLA